MHNNKKNLVMVCAGDESRHRDYCVDRDERIFDVLIIYYGDVLNMYKYESDYYFAQKGTKYLAAQDRIIFEGDCVSTMQGFSYFVF